MIYADITSSEFPREGYLPDSVVDNYSMGVEQFKTLAESHDGQSDGDIVEYTWTESEEKALVRK